MDNLVERANKLSNDLKTAFDSIHRRHVRQVLNEASAFIEEILPTLVAEEVDKNKEVKSVELTLSFKEQLLLKGAERIEEIKEEREIKHKLWLKNNTELIDYFKRQLLKTVQNTGAKAETVPLGNRTITNNDIDEIYYYFEKEGIRVSGQGFTPVKEDAFGNKSLTYTSLRFNWED